MNPGLALVAAASLMAQQGLPADDPHAEDRKVLVGLLHEIEASINSQDLTRMVKQFDDHAVVVWANAEVTHGPAEALAYYDRMVKGKDRILTKYTTTAKLDGHARFLGDGTIAVANGSMVDEFFPVIRGPFKLDSKWTTTVGKINGEWKVLSLHLSANVFNNVLLDETKSLLLYVGLGALASGALLGWLISRFLAR